MAPVGRIPYLAWNQDLAGWMENKMLGENVRRPSSLGFIPPPHTSPQGQQQVFHTWMPEESPALGVRTCPLSGIQLKKREQTHTRPVLPFQLKQTWPRRTKRLEFSGTIYYSPCLMEKLGLRGGQCLVTEGEMYMFQVPALSSAASDTARSQNWSLQPL